MSETSNYRAISIAELDFDTLKNSFKEFLNSQDEYQDFDLEGSALNTLIDILIQNTSANAYMASMLGNEAFIDSAQLRQSVVSLAKLLSYTPRSKRSAKAVVNIDVPNITDGSPYITLYAGTKFTNKFNILFTTPDDILLHPNGSDYSVRNIDIYEGSLIQFDYTVDDSDINQRFVIESLNVDISSLRVFVKNSSSSSTKVEYQLVPNITVLDRYSENYFIEEGSDGKYIVSFGDDILGKSVQDGNVIILSYIITAAIDNEANNITEFIPKEQIYGEGDYTISVVEKSYGGADRESIESVRHLAPNMYEAQNRGVIEADYVAFLLSEYPWIDAVNVWGGEHNDPPIYGKVFFSIKPNGAEFLTNSLKIQIAEDVISKYNVVTVIPEFIDAEYIYILVNTKVTYDKNRTVKSSADIETGVITTIDNYFISTTSTYSANFYHSPLSTKIDYSDESIVSNITDIQLQLRTKPIKNSTSSQQLNFRNSIQPGSFISTKINQKDVFTDEIDAFYIIDDSNGNLNAINAITKEITSEVGSIDYDTGICNINVYIRELPEDSEDIRYNATPVEKDIIIKNNNIILPDNTREFSKYMRVQGITAEIIEI